MSDQTLRSLMAMQAEAIQEIILHEGELTEEHEAVLESLMKKVDNLQFFRSALESERERFHAFVKELQAHVKRIDSRLGWLDSYVIQNMMQNGQNEIAGEMIKFVLQQNPPSVVIEDESATPQKYWTAVTEMKLDKKAIADELKAGRAVSGARLQRGVRLVVKPNSVLVKAKGVVNE